MLSTEQTTEFARRMYHYFQHQDDLPLTAQGVMVYNGWFPTNLDEVVRDVVEGCPFTPDNQPVTIHIPEPEVQRDLNAGYHGSINLALEDGVLTVTAPRILAGYPPRVTIDKEARLIHISDNQRALPEFLALVDFDGTQARVEDGNIVFELNVMERDIVDEDYDDYWDDEEIPF